MFRLALVLLSVLAFPFLAAAQDRPNTILVLDASGSMWGQIDGVAKITIAQEVVTGLLQTLPETEALGLTVYGHRKRGDCTDIETVVSPAAGTRDQIAAAVAAIQPLGKTPMTDAVIAAAESLRYTEEAATVILVSDGVETCNPDPCAAARALEAAGIDFTAHVIGFDITDPEALRQMQCIADETGGRFLTAANASELTAALANVAAEPEPAPPPASVAFLATAGEADRDISAEVVWDLTGADGTLSIGGTEAALSVELAPGPYSAVAYWTKAEAEVPLSFEAVPGTQTVIARFDEPLPAATLDGPETAAAGSTVQIGWTGPDEPHDFIAVSEIGERSSSYLTYSYSGRGNPVELEMPANPGTYELRYVRSEGMSILATRQIVVTPVTATLEAAESAPAGQTIPVTWTGPAYELDYIAIGKPGNRDYVSYRYTRDGTPAQLELPAEPGLYELRYVMSQGTTVLVTRPIEVTDIAASLTAPPQAAAGATISVGWAGPGYDRDYIAVGKPGERDYVNYTYVERGNPLDLVLPPEPGGYELRYVLGQDSSVLVSQPITVTEITAAIVAPDAAIAGETVLVGWEGPDYDRDYIAVAKPGERDYLNYAYTGNGNPVEVEMPVDPGTYELRYVLNQGERVLATRSISVAPLKVELVGPATAVAGDTIQIGWNGPGYDRDYVSVGPLDGGRYITYSYTRLGNPLELQMPSMPGDYEIRYQLAQDDEIMARLPITVTEVKAALVAEATVSLSSGIVTVGWDGPGYQRDYLAIAVPGDNGYLTYQYTDRGNPVEMTLPDTAGTYEIRYVMSQDTRILARIPLTVTAD